MAISVECDVCGHEYTISDENAGRAFRCKSCDNRIEVPDGSAKREKPRSARRTKKTNRQPVIIGVGIGVSVLVAVFAVLTLMKDRQQPIDPRFPPAAGANGPANIPGAPPDFGDVPFPGRPGISPFPGHPGAAGGRNIAPPQVGPPTPPAPPGPTTAKNEFAGVGVSPSTGVLKYWFDIAAKQRLNPLTVVDHRPDVDSLIESNYTADPPQTPFELAIVSDAEETEKPPARNSKAADDNETQSPNQSSPLSELYRIEIPFSKVAPFNNGFITFTTLPSPLVALGDNSHNDDRREIWDLSKNIRVGRITGLSVASSFNALSPDGKYFAGISKGRGFAQIIGVWDIQEKKPVATIETSRDDTPQEIHFLGNDRLFSVVENGARLIEYDISTGEQRRAVTVAKGGAGTLAFSPGGNFIASPVLVQDEQRARWGRRDQPLKVTVLNPYEPQVGSWPTSEPKPETYDAYVQVLDLNNGRCVCLFPFPHPLVQFVCKELAFSPDGTRLAAFFLARSTALVVAWDLATGKLADYVAVNLTSDRNTEAPKPLDDPALGFLSQNRGFLLSDFELVDAKARGIVGSLPPYPEPARHITGKHHLLGNEYVTSVRVANEKAFLAVNRLTLPPADSSAPAGNSALEVAVQQVTANDIPSLNRFNSGVARSIDAPATPQWSVEPDPATGYSGGLVDGFDLYLGNGRMSQLAFAKTVPRCCVLRSETPLNLPPLPYQPTLPTHLLAQRIEKEWGLYYHAPVRDPVLLATSPTMLSEQYLPAATVPEGISRRASDFRRKSWIDVYDLASGQRTREIMLPFDAALASISPDGTQSLVVKCDEINNTLHVFSNDDGTHVNSLVYDKSVAGTAPSFHELVTGMEPQKLDNVVVAAQFIDNQRVMVFNGGGKVFVWDVAGGTIPFEFANSNQPVLSAGGRYLSFGDGSNYYVVETATGNVKGILQNVNTVPISAYHPRGTQLALVTHDKKGKSLTLQLYDLANGALLKQLPLSKVPHYLRWLSDGYLLVNNESVVDVEKGWVLWQYALEEGDHLPDSLDGRHWFVVRRNRRPTLRAVELPMQDDLAAVSQANLQPEYFLYPGCTCSLAVNSNRGDQQQIFDRLYAKLTAAGVKVAENQPVVIYVNAAVTDAGQQTMNYRRLFGGSRDQPENISITYNHRDFKLELTVSKGNEIGYETSASTSNSPGGIVNENPRAATDAEFQASIESSIDGIDIPALVISPRTRDGLGTTKLESLVNSSSEDVDGAEDSPVEGTAPQAALPERGP